MDLKNIQKQISPANSKRIVNMFLVLFSTGKQGFYITHHQTSLMQPPELIIGNPGKSNKHCNYQKHN
jgi:hypothetical protein